MFWKIRKFHQQKKMRRHGLPAEADGDVEPPKPNESIAKLVAIAGGAAVAGFILGRYFAAWGTVAARTSRSAQRDSQEKMSTALKDRDAQDRDASTAGYFTSDCSCVREKTGAVTARQNGGSSGSGEAEGSVRCADVVAGHSLPGKGKKSKSRIKRVHGESGPSTSSGRERFPACLVRGNHFLKPLFEGTRGEREESFYRSSIASKTEGGPIPMFYGTTAIDGLVYLEIENIEDGFHHPCTIDIKLGCQSWGPGADEARQKRARAKWPHMETLACAVCGMKVHSNILGTYRRLGKKYGRGLGIDGLKQALVAFLHNGETLRRDVLLPLIEQVCRVRDWLKEHPALRCYSSSVLLIYEGKIVAPVQQPDDCSEASGNSKARACLVDFAHTYVVEDVGKVDSPFQKDSSLAQRENCLRGLDNLICCLDELHRFFLGRNDE